MPATNQRSTPSRTRRRKGKVKLGFQGTGHAPSSATNRRQHTTKKSDPFRQTSLFASSAGGKGVFASKGDGFPKRKRGRHRLITKQGSRRAGEIGTGGM